MEMRVGGRGLLLVVRRPPFAVCRPPSVVPRLSSASVVRVRVRALVPFRLASSPFMQRCPPQQRRKTEIRSAHEDAHEDGRRKTEDEGGQTHDVAARSGVASRALWITQAAEK